VTTAEMMTAVRDAFGEDSTTATQISPTQILAFLNRAQVELCADSNILVSAWTTSTVSGQQRYSVPPEYTSVEEIMFWDTSHGQKWLDKVSIGDIDPTLLAGAPDRFAVWGANVSGDNSPTFWLDPIPNFSGSSDLTCYGRQLPKTMVSGGQAPEVRLRWQYACVNGAVAYTYQRLSAGDPTLLPLLDRAMAIWKADKAEAEETVYMDVKSPGRVRDVMGYVTPRF
jgi:hypothetical protein